MTENVPVIVRNELTNRQPVCCWDVKLTTTTQSASRAPTSAAAVPPFYGSLSNLRGVSLAHLRFLHVCVGIYTKPCRAGRATRLAIGWPGRLVQRTIKEVAGRVCVCMRCVCVHAMCVCVCVCVCVRVRQRMCL